MNQQQLSPLVNSATRFPRPSGTNHAPPSSIAPFQVAPLLSSAFSSTRFSLIRLDILVRRIRSYGRCIDAGISCVPVGGLAALRSIQTRTAVGLMIGASSDQVSDNGVLIIDLGGFMLSQSWAKFAGKLANAYDLPEFIKKLDHFVVMENIWLEGAPGGVVLLGRDTRPSGRTLLQAAEQGVTSFMGTTASDVGVVTTPQLQGMLRAKNQGQ